MSKQKKSSTQILQEIKNILARRKPGYEACRKACEEIESLFDPEEMELTYCLYDPEAELTMPKNGPWKPLNQARQQKAGPFKNTLRQNLSRKHRSCIVIRSDGLRTPIGKWLLENMDASKDERWKRLYCFLVAG